MRYLMILMLLFITCKPVAQQTNYGRTLEAMDIKYKLFKGMTGKQFAAVWDDLFFDCNYKLGELGPTEYDCSTASWTMMRHIGARYECMNVEAFMKKLGKKRVSIKRVEVGDVIIWLPKKSKSGDIWHMAWVVDIDIKRGRLEYVDLNVSDNGPGRNWITYHSPRLAGVFRLPFVLYTGYY